ncbi:MAG: signal peptidase I [Deltaproteobacteria bacterium]|nr:signal peptidase I [Deltaproteobacteria bacterium]
MAAKTPDKTVQAEGGAAAGGAAAGPRAGGGALRAGLRALAALVIAVIGALIVILAVGARQIADDEMAWSLRRGEWVWLHRGPTRAWDGLLPADVVLVADPLQSGRTVLRRVVATGGQTVTFDEGGVRVNAKRLRVQEMGDQPGVFVRKETIWSKPPARANDYLLMVDNPTTRWAAAGEVKVPEGHLFLLADARDLALDSRWWGPVPASSVIGVVRAHLAEPDLWRPRLRLLRPEE